MAILILVRHGQSIWNLENRFTGEVDVPLTTLGEQEAIHAGVLLQSFKIDIAFTSVLQRAIRTLELIIGQRKDAIHFLKSSAMNERNYGDLQGLNKTETEHKFGADQVLLWRRSYDVKPPQGESLKDTFDRVVPYYKNEIQPLLQTDKNVLIVAHGNSLRALMMYLEEIGQVEISDVNIATGMPRVYIFSATLKLEKVYNLN